MQDETATMGDQRTINVKQQRKALNQQRSKSSLDA